MCALACTLHPGSQCANNGDDTRKDNHHSRRNSKLNEWVDINSVPRKITDSASHSLCTSQNFRFARKLPMTKSDWKKFEEWVQIRGTPKRSFAGNEEPKPKSNKSPSMARLNFLSLPKNRNEKYEYETKIYTFEPNIERRNIPENRIRQPSDYRIIKTFQHPDIESKFWREFKFPVSHNALSYQLDERIKKLSEPKNPTSPYSNSHAFLARDRSHAMTFAQWKNYKTKLQNLAKPKKTFVEKPKKVSRGKKVPLSELQPRINSLSISPKAYRYEEYYNSSPNKKSSRSPKKFQRWLNNLAKPRKRPILEEPKPIGINETALKAHASKRLKCLALPRKTRQTQQEKRKEKNKIKKYMEDIIMGSNYERCMTEKPKKRKKSKKEIIDIKETKEPSQLTTASHYST